MVGPIAAAPVTIDFGAPGSLYNDANGGWFLRFTSGPSGVQIQQVTLTLGGSLAFDTTGLFGGPFVADPHGLNIGTPAFLTTTSNPVPDGSTSFSMAFNNFGVGDVPLDDRRGFQRELY